MNRLDIWTAAQIQALREAAALGADLVDLAAVIGRTPAAVHQRAHLLGIGGLDARRFFRERNARLRGDAPDAPFISDAAARARAAWKRRKARLAAGLATKSNAKPRAVGKVRACLCCRARFRSEGNHNRLCVRCRAAAHDVSPIEFGVAL